MFNVLDSQNILKRRVALAILSLTTIGATIAAILHRFQTAPHLIDLFASTFLAIASLFLLIYLYFKPESLRQVAHLALFVTIVFLVLPSWLFTLQAFSLKDFTLVGSLPPITSALFLLTTIMLIFLRPQRLLYVAIAAWVAIASPIVIYLVLHPVEMLTARGMDLLISLGPAMGVQIVLIFFYNRLQNIIDRLYAERLQYYSQIIERQSIRQQAIEQAFSQIHNGPLQTLALLLREVQKEQTIPNSELLQRLIELNTEIRSVGQNLKTDGDPDKSLIDSASLEPTISESVLRLGEGTCINLTDPLHQLFHEVYVLTLKRNLPYFQTIQVKVRNFAPLENFPFTLELKRDLCLWLEEALCNVGKHAEGVTRIIVIGEQINNCYILKIEDNGNGLKTSEGELKEQQGTQLCYALAEKLGGRFQRSPLPKGGVCCELCWSIDH
jgi:anti-sigma regulatory factor (Ser/Thr protein kinase)